MNLRVLNTEKSSVKLEKKIDTYYAIRAKLLSSILDRHDNLKIVQ